MPVSVDLGLALNFVFLGAGAWASARHFTRSEREPTGATLLTIATVVGTALNVWHTLHHPDAAAGLDADVAIAISLAAFVLFFAAIHATRHQGLSLAFSDRTPGSVINGGIYNVIRHPFYASYILYWLSWLPLTSLDPVACALAALMIGAYTIAAGKEERLLVARLGPSYSTLMRRTWRFVPGIH